MAKSKGNLPSYAVRLETGVAWCLAAVPSKTNPAYFSIKLVSLTEIEGKANWWLRGYRLTGGGTCTRGGLVRDADLKMLETIRPSLYSKVEPRLDALAADFAATYEPAPVVTGEEEF